MRCEVPPDSRQALTQFLPIATVPPVANRAEPLKTVGLADDRARPHHFPTLAPGVASRTHVIQPPKRWGQVFGLWQGTLTGRFPGAIDVKDHPGVPRSIHETTRLLLVGVGGEWAALEIVEKEGTQGFDGFGCQRRQKAREGRTGGQSITLKQGHEGDCEGLESLVKSFQGAFSTDRIPEKDGEKVDHLVVPEPPSCKAHTLTDLAEDALLAQMRSHQHHFAKPGRRREDGFSRGLDMYRSIGDTGHICLLERMEMVFLSQRGTFLSLLATA